MITGFESFMIDRGYFLTHGSLEPLNTYNNCGRAYSNGKHSFSIALYGKPTRIGITYPMIYLGTFDRIPEPADFEIIARGIEHKDELTEEEIIAFHLKYYQKNINNGKKTLIMAKTYVQKFEENEFVFFIYNSEILYKKIKKVYFNCGFQYKVGIRSYADLWLGEHECFETLESLFEHWKQKISNKK